MSLTIRRVLQLKGVVGVETVTPETPLSAALQKMEAKGVGLLVVTADDGEMIGGLSYADIARKVVTDGEDALPELVSDAMHCASAVCALDDEARDALGRMEATPARHLTVIDADTVVGVVSVGDILRAIVREKALRGASIASAA